MKSYKIRDDLFFKNKERNCVILEKYSYKGNDFFIIARSYSSDRVYFGGVSRLKIESISDNDLCSFLEPKLYWMTCSDLMEKQRPFLEKDFISEVKELSSEQVDKINLYFKRERFRTAKKQIRNYVNRKVK